MGIQTRNPPDDRPQLQRTTQRRFTIHSFRQGLRAFNSDHIAQEVHLHRHEGKILMATLEELLATANSGGVDNTELYDRLVDDQILTEDQLAEASKSQDWYARLLVASHPSVGVDTLTYLARDPSTPVRTAVAQCYRTPLSVLEGLTLDPHWEVREALANNPSISTDMLSVFSTDSEVSVRWTVARNTRTPAKDLTLLADDICFDVQEAVAQNPNTPPLVRMFLQSKGYSDMTLEEFLQQTEATK